MKKFLLSSFVIITFIFYSLHEKLQASEVANVIAPTNFLPTNPTDSAQPISNNQPSATFTKTAATGIYKDGQYTGDVTDAFYGNVQVKVTIQNGKISDVQFLNYPHDRGTSVMINSQAMPYLKAEAIQAQNANVDIVSGATATSQAFIQSLKSALAQAKG